MNTQGQNKGTHNTIQERNIKEEDKAALALIDVLSAPKQNSNPIPMDVDIATHIHNSLHRQLDDLHRHQNAVSTRQAIKDVARIMSHLVAMRLLARVNTITDTDIGTGVDTQLVGNGSIGRIWPINYKLGRLHGQYEGHHNPHTQELLTHLRMHKGKTTNRNISRMDWVEWISVAITLSTKALTKTGYGADIPWIILREIEHWHRLRHKVETQEVEETPFHPPNEGPNGYNTWNIRLLPEAMIETELEITFILPDEVAVYHESKQKITADQVRAEDSIQLLYQGQRTHKTVKYILNRQMKLGGKRTPHEHYPLTRLERANRGMKGKGWAETTKEPGYTILGMGNKQTVNQTYALKAYCHNSRKPIVIHEGVMDPRST